MHMCYKYYIYIYYKNIIIYQIILYYIYIILYVYIILYMYLYIYNITTMRGHIPNHHISPRMDLAAYCHETPFADLC